MDVVDRFVEVVPDLPGPPPGDPQVLFRRGRRRRRRRRTVLASGSALGVIAVVASVVGLQGGTDRTVPEIADRPSGDLVEQAPNAGAVDEHWPIELIYAKDARELRFRGTSWADWSVELRVGEDTWRLVDRQHPGEEYETEGAGAFLDDGSHESEGFVRVPGPPLMGSWRSGTGLGDRTVVELSAVPGGGELVGAMGLSPEDVEAYVTPNVVGCDGPLGDCVPAGETGARGIAHLPTGFPLFAEEAGTGGGSYVYLEVRSIRWADPGVAPVPADQIPRMSDLAAAEDERATEGGATGVPGTLVEGSFDLDDAHLWSADGHPSEVATRFVREVLGWGDAAPIDLSGDLPGSASVTVRGLGMREVSVDLVALDDAGDRYGITRVDDRADPELRVAANGDLVWRPSVPREVAGGIALVRTTDGRTVRLDLDQDTTAGGRVSLDGHVGSEGPACEQVLTALVAILDGDGRVLDVTAARWGEHDPASCR